MVKGDAQKGGLAQPSMIWIVHLFTIYELPTWDKHPLHTRFDPHRQPFLGYKVLAGTLML